MAKKVLINVEERELRVAILEDGQLVELYIESLDNKTILNNVYRGKVENILSGLNAVFVNIGFDKNAFLHFNDIRPELLLTADSKVELAAYEAKCAEVEQQLDLLEEEEGEPASENAEGENGSSPKTGGWNADERNDRRRNKYRDRKDRRDRRRLPGQVASESGSATVVESTGDQVPARSEEETSENRDKKKRRDRKKKRGKGPVGEGQQPFIDGQDVFLPPPVDPELIGTRAAANPFDVFTPYAPQAKGRKTRRGNKPQAAQMVGWDVLPAEVHDDRDSQADFFGVVDSGMNDNLNDLDESMPGNELEPNGKKKRRNRDRRRTFKRREDSNFAVRKKTVESESAEPENKEVAKPKKSVGKTAASKAKSEDEKTVVKKSVTAKKVSGKTAAVKKTTSKTKAVDADESQKSVVETGVKKTSVSKAKTSSAKTELEGLVVEGTPSLSEKITTTKKTVSKLSTVSGEANVEKPVAEKKKSVSKKAAAVKEEAAPEEAPKPKTVKKSASKSKAVTPAEELPLGMPVEEPKKKTVAKKTVTERKPQVKAEPVAEEIPAETVKTEVTEPVAVPVRKKSSSSKSKSSKTVKTPVKEEMPVASWAITEEHLVPVDGVPVYNLPQSSDKPVAVVEKTAINAGNAAIKLVDVVGKPSFPPRPKLKYLPVVEALKKGDEILVQVTKEEIGVKGARITTFLSLPGRYLVLMPNADEEGAGGISRKVSDFNERKRLKKVLRGIRRDIGDRSVGVIVRTAGVDRDEKEIRSDADFLSSQWKRIQTTYEKKSAPALVYDDSDILHRLARDVFDDNITEIEIDSSTEGDKLKEMLGRLIPSLVDKVKVYDRPVNIFRHYDIERQIQKAGRRKVWLRSGGYLIIDEAEALAAIDVNSGKFVGKDDQEKMILKTNMEAARAIARELRLRDIGGIIVIDFIDMRDMRNRETLLNEFRGLLKKDRAKTNVSGISEFGLVEMTRKRVRRSLRRTIFADCPYCLGAGVVLNDGQIWLHMKHEIVGILNSPTCPETLNVQVHTKLKAYIDANYGETIARWREEFGREVVFHPNEQLHTEQYGFESIDEDFTAGDAAEFQEAVASVVEPTPEEKAESDTPPAPKRRRKKNEKQD